MKLNDTRIPSPIFEGPTAGAGYTYFGQFIDHDLTEDRTPLRVAGLTEPKDTENRRTCWLDLDNLYGHGPRCPLYRDLYEPNEVSFRLGEPRINGEAFDVPLVNKEPRLADGRNNENIIVRQIHAMFLKLHNRAVTELEQTTPRLRPQDLFDRAQERVRWQYQWLVRHDFLKTICNDAVHEDVVEKGNRRIDWPNGFSIPVEFSQAAFRFGHSMVRFEYDLNRESRDVPLSVLFGPITRDPLGVEFAIDWDAFMKPNVSMRIDTSIVEPLFDLPDESISRFVASKSPHDSKELPFRTLYRGAANRLPTGQQVRGKLCPSTTMKQPREVPNHRYDPWNKLREFGLDKETPLWYYILLEAEIDEIGENLGIVGSRLVLEVIEESLLSDPNSFINRFGRNWKPPPWKRADGSDFEIRSLHDLAKFVGLARDNAGLNAHS